MEKSANRGSTALNSTKIAKQAHRDAALQQSAPDSHLKLALSMTVAACVLRLIILFVTPLELHLSKVSAKGARADWRFNPSWIRLEKEEDEEFE